MPDNYVEIDPDVKRAYELKTNAQSLIDLETDQWEESERMYNDCFDGSDNPARQNNPIILKQTIDRGMESYGLVDYTLRIPESTPEERIIFRDMISQIEGSSGLTSAMRDDPRGNLGQFLFGLSLYWFGLDERKDAKTPIIVQNIALQQAFFSTSALMLRTPNGFGDAPEGFIVFDRSSTECQKIYPESENPKMADVVESGGGKLPIFTRDGKIQTPELSREEEVRKLTQDGHYYDIDRGIYKVIVGKNGTVIKEYDDNNPKLPDYPYKLDGRNVIPVFCLRTFPTTNSFYPKGFYHLFGKTARNSAWRKSRARQYVDRNVLPPAFVKMKSDNLAEFQNQVDIQNEARRIGEDSYIQLGLEDEVVVGELRGQPLTNDFERLKQDDQQDIIESGIAITDVGRKMVLNNPQLIAEEQAKTRLISQIIRNNAEEGKFIREVIIHFIKKFVHKDNKTLIATNLKLKSKPTPEDSKRAQKLAMDMNISVEQALAQILPEFSADGVVTFGQASESFREKKSITVQEDFSAWEDTGFKLKKLQAQLAMAIGTPAQLEIQKEILGTLGRDVFSQDIQPHTNPNLYVPQSVQGNPQSAQGLPSQNRSAQIQGGLGTP